MAVSDSLHWNIHLSSAVNIFFSWGCIMHVDVCMHTHKYMSRYLVRGFRKQAVFRFHCIRYLASKISPLLKKMILDFVLEAPLFFLGQYYIERKTQIPLAFLKPNSRLTVLFHISICHSASPDLTHHSSGTGCLLPTLLMINPLPERRAFVLD